jgi:hypothetical protein
MVRENTLAYLAAASVRQTKEFCDIRLQILYQTERYHTSTFGYDIPVAEDGHYLLILKFSEVYFNAPNMKVSLKTESLCLKCMGGTQKLLRYSSLK